MVVGVLALQGAFREHQQVLEAMGVKTRQVRKPEELEGISALIIPGGESTAIGKLLVDYGLMEPIREMAAGGLPIFGTCAGLILLAKEITGSPQPRLGLMDIRAERNAFGRQVESFEVDLEVPALGEKPLRAVFIRAPYISAVGPGVEVLASLGDGKIVMARQGRYLACAFHPELTEDRRVHRYFLEHCS
ncbi:pyridoxal 5'-phosphate synthase glutaminase subunit PdxT [Desulfovirgula thermocuniculi]|uniref:pyridoxal 5'-phosphate synthase glutaminase subunit PdxT n=1 Tax=Desulfovirgula thermocuniculi TaxID=348842 RepID=UPI0004870297|nr:pyridoxal 5'-phosphate synthase glutaminase subunit PdxT [Desulfovirgula thermocuniculi]